MRMLGKPDAPADRSVASFTASVQYAGIVYGKAPYFFGAAREAVGDAAFFSAMKAYVAKYRFAEAPPRGLVDILAAGAETKVRSIERRWLDETHGDEDIGTLDPSSLLGGAAGMGGLGDIDQVMKALQQAGGALGGGANGSGGVPAPGNMDMEELLKQLGGGQ
jgi:hypothetical protein